MAKKYYTMSPQEWDSLPDPNVPDGVNYMEDELDEPITGLWNWTMMGYTKPDEKIIKKKLVGADV